MSATVIVDGTVTNVCGVKLFRGIVGGGVVPTGTTVTSGLITLMIVPGVAAGIVETFAGINRTGIARPLGNKSGFVTLPEPVVESVILIAPEGGTSFPAPIMLMGPKQI